MIASVIVDIKAYAVDHVFDYEVPQGLDLKIGTRVRVPFGSRDVDGYVVSLKSESDFETNKLKMITSVSDIQFLNEELIELAQHVASSTASFTTSVLQTMLPKDILKRTASSREWVVDLKKTTLSSQAKKQVALQQYILDTGLPLLKKDLIDMFGRSAFNGLNEKGVLTIQSIKDDFFMADTNIGMKAKAESKKALTDSQMSALEKIESSTNEVVLLKGVTGSGKTEVFLQYVEKVIQSGESALILVPEIGLTTQIIKQFEDRFGLDEIAILHSKLSPSKRFNMWKKIKAGASKIVLGTRSAIFAPLENIGVIILDEEHDSSYKQENMPSYHARDVAIWRGNFHHAKVILASATPSLESYIRAQKGVYQLVELKHRINQSVPDVQIIDMRASIGNETYRYISEPLHNAIENALLQNEQVILMINRRGYAPILQCESCGYVPECPNCDVSLVYHQKGKKNVCHYCQYEEVSHQKCPSCQQQMILDGVGIQKIEEELHRQFAGVRVIRADKDNVKNLKDYEQLYTSFSRQEAEILLGTQMIAKGFDFPNVTVVGILEVDQLLHIPDFRSEEKAYQLLRQAIGRAGRGEKKGTAYIQTFDTTQPLFNELVREDYDAFAQEEIQRRQAFAQPPFWHMSDIIISSPKQNDAAATAMYMYQQLQQLQQHAKVYAPSATFIARKNNRFYFHILIKYKNSSVVLSNITKLVEHVSKTRKNVQTYVQVNPLSFE